MQPLTVLFVIFFPISVLGSGFEAAAVGIIGATSHALSKMGEIPVATVASGCQWHGTPPICAGKCPDGWSEIRNEVLWEKYEEKKPGSCWLGQKLFCCRTTGTDRSWTGNWVSDKTGELTYCQYKQDIFNKAVDFLGYFCGKLHCLKASGTRTTVFEIGAKFWHSDFGGHKCDELYPMDSKGSRIGTVEFGRISWKNRGSEDYHEKWYKIND